MSLVKETTTGSNYLEKIETGADEGSIAAIQFYEKQAGSDGAAGNTVFTLTTGEYIPGSYTLMVFVNGQKSELKTGAAAADEYTETNSTVITFGAGLQNADVVEFVVAGSYNVTDVDFVEDAAYGAGWNGDTTHAPSQNAVYDLLQAGNWDARVKGWCNFDGTGDCTPDDSFNVSSVTDNGAGNYTVNWDTDFANDDYAVSLSIIVGHHPLLGVIAVGSIQVLNYNDTWGAEDTSMLCVSAIGDQ